MNEVSYRYCHFPPAVIQHAVWLYCRFTLSFRDIEELLAERGIEVSYETIWRWVARFGPAYAERLRPLRGIVTLIRNGPILVLLCKAKSLKKLRVTIGESL